MQVQSNRDFAIKDHEKAIKGHKKAKQDHNRLLKAMLKVEAVKT